MLLFLFDLVVGLLYFDVEPLVVNVDRLKTNTNSIIVPCLGVYSDDPGVDRLIKGDINFFIGIVAGLISFTPVDGLKGLAIEGRIHLNDCHPLTITGVTLENEFSPESRGLRAYLNPLSNFITIRSPSLIGGG